MFIKMPDDAGNLAAWDKWSKDMGLQDDGLGTLGAMTILAGIILVIIGFLL